MATVTTINGPDSPELCDTLLVDRESIDALAMVERYQKPFDNTILEVLDV